MFPQTYGLLRHLYSTDAVAACVVLHNICELNNDHCNPEWIHVDESVRDHSTPHGDLPR